MAVLQKDDVLSLKEKKESCFYNFGVVQLVETPDEKTENKITATIEKEFIKKDKFGYLYTIRVTDRKQSNIEEMLGVEEALFFLKKKVVLYTSQYGEVISVVNRPQIKEDWYEESKKFKANFTGILPDINQFIDGVNGLLDDNKAFVNFIKKSDIYNILFPTIYNVDLEQRIAIQQKKEFHNFFDRYSLPLNLDTKIVGRNIDTNGLQIIRGGKLDTYRFNKEGASEMFKHQYGVHHTALKFNVSYMETYDTDSLGGIDAANNMLGVQVSELYSLKQITKLIKKEK